MTKLLKPLFILIIMTSSQSYFTQEQTTESQQTSSEQNTSSEQATSNLEQPKTQATASPSANNNFGILGMNVRGNKESPMALNIVPWRSANHLQIDPEVTPGWQPKLTLLQPTAYRREINAFLKARSSQKKTN